MEAHLTYVTTKDGNGVVSVSFGPFADRSLALLVADRLAKRGLAAGVVSEQEAKEIDCHGYYKLRQNAPMDWNS